jgi:heme/copper-type cytochrome/quinol oxidase subunit 2
MLNILRFYDYAIFPVFGLGLLVAFLIGFVMVAPRSQLKIYTRRVLEWFWTVVPMFILIFLGYPSILLLYASREVNRPLLTFKAVGHQ